MARLTLNALTHWVTAAAVERPRGLPGELARHFGVSPGTARSAVKRLVELQWLALSGSGRQTRYAPGLMREVVRRYDLDGLEEDLPWRLHFAPYLALPDSVRRMVEHTFCELLNNAIDHSAGTQVTVSLRQTGSHVQLLVSDNGEGLFHRIAQSFSIADPHLAMLELSKGKLSTQPQRHSGQGLFFVSQLADVFDLHANESAFQRRDWDDRGWQAQRPLRRGGTSVYASFALETPRTIEGVRKAYSLDGGGAAFDRTVVPLRLLTSDVASLCSRAQARRVGARLNEFRRAELDFSGVDALGHAFADELFRVVQCQSPDLELVPLNMCASVEAMVNSVRTPHASAAQTCLAW